MFQKGCVLQCKIDSLFKNRVNYNSKLVIFQKHCFLQWIIDVFRGAKNIVKHSTFEMCGSETMYFTMNLEDSENQSWKWSQFDWFSKKLKNMWFFILFWSKKQFLSTVSQKWMQNGPGLDSGWVGLAGLGRAGPGLCLGLVLSTSGTKARISSNRASWVWFSRFLEPTPESV